MRRTDQIEFESTTFNVIAPYPSTQTPEEAKVIYSPKKYGKVKMLLTIGEWEGPSGKQYVGEWLTKDDHYSPTYSCLAQEKFNLYRKCKDKTLSLEGEFLPVHSYTEDGGEHIPVMSWKGCFYFRGADYEWEGSCVWELATLLSDWGGMLDETNDIGVAKAAKMALEKAGAIEMEIN